MQTPKQRLFESASVYLDEILECSIQSVVTESPIELELLRALYLFSIVKYTQIPHERNAGQTSLTVATQKKIGSYRVDFLITTNETDIKVVVECDGHEFHERTKQQAAKDKSRDRQLVSLGYAVLRFTGSEIWKDPWECASEINDLIVNSWLKKWFAK